MTAPAPHRTTPADYAWTGYTPFEDQVACLDGITDALRAGHRRILLRAPTGAGKTVMFSIIARMLARRGKRSILCAHRQELIDQISRTLKTPHGVIAAGHAPRRSEVIQVASIGSLRNRTDAYPADLMIWDEAHHCTASTYRAIAAAYPKAAHLGVTATPVRADGRGLRDAFDHLVMGPAVTELISLGRLCRSEVYHPQGARINTQNIERHGRRYDDRALDAEVNQRKIVGDLVEAYRMYAEGRRTLCYGVNLEHAQNIADVFNAAGYRAARIDGKMKPAARRALVQEFQAGRITHLTSVALVGEGFDLPGIEAQIDAAPTLSLGWLIQKLGRGMRVSAGKTEQIYIDCANNCGENNHHPNLDREWSLDGIADNREAVAVPLVSTCDSCYRTFPGRGECPWCGFVPESVQRQLLHEMGELQRLQEAQIAAAMEQARKEKLKRDLRGIPSPGGIERLNEIAEANGFSPAWVAVQVRLRQKYNPEWGKAVDAARGVAV